MHMVDINPVEIINSKRQMLKKIVLLIIGILILLAAIISPLSIVIGGTVGIAFIVAGTVIQIKKSRTK